MKNRTDNRINLRVNTQNWQDWSKIESFFKTDPYLKTKVKSRNDMLNFIISTFLLLYINSTEKQYMSREAELLGHNNSNITNEVVEILNNIGRKLSFVEDKAQKNNYMMLGMFNRASVSLNDGGSIYSPETPNYRLNKKLDEIIASDIHSNQVRQQKFNR